MSGKPWAVQFRKDSRTQARLPEANHPPRAVLNGDGGKSILQLTAAAGENLLLSAAGSSDPDGHELTYEWFVYREAGTYAGDVSLSAKDAQSRRLEIPVDASGKTIHVVLALRDRGTPPLASYRRAVVSITK